MTTLDQTYWEERWKNQETGWDIGYASPAILKIFENQKDKNIKILIPGCGNGYEAEAFYNMGFQDITLLDISATAVNNLQERFADKEGITILNEDFFEHQETYDFIVEQTFFCALNPNLREAYRDKMHQLLKENGKLVGLLFAKEFEKDGPPFGGNLEEYLILFQSKFVISRLEKCEDSILPRKNNELILEFVKK